MRLGFSFSRYSMLWKVIACYLLPMAALIFFEDSWNFVRLWLFLSLCGTLALFLMMVRYAVVSRSGNHTAPPLPSFVPPSSNEETIENQRLKAKVEELDQELQQRFLDIQQKNLNTEQFAAELNEQRTINAEQLSQLERQQKQIRDLQGIIAEHRAMIEKRQQQIVQLETKVGDLTYEIKTLLKLAEAHSSTLESKPLEDTTFPPPQPFQPSLSVSEETPQISSNKQIQSSEEASIQLKRCLDTAQKMTGSYRFNSHGNYLSELPMDGFALDLRRLCDSFRSETNCTILLYSPKENEVLFASNQIKAATGWSPDKFMQNFFNILQDPSAWTQGVASLAAKSETEVKVSLKARTGPDLTLSARMGLIPTGVFKQHLVAILF